MKIHFYLLLGLLVSAGFYLGFNENEKDPISKSKKVSAGRIGGTNPSPAFIEKNNIYCAILLMPKSYLPMLRQFAKHKLAKDIQIIPAEINWHEDNMIVLPQKSKLQNKSYPAKSGGPHRHPTNLAAVSPEPEFRAKIRTAAFLTLLAGVKKTGSNFFLSGRNHHKK